MEVYLMEQKFYTLCNSNNCYKVNFGKCQEEKFSTEFDDIWKKHLKISTNQINFWAHFKVNCMLSNYIFVDLLFWAIMEMNAKTNKVKVKYSNPYFYEH